MKRHTRSRPACRITAALSVCTLLAGACADAPTEPRVASTRSFDEVVTLSEVLNCSGGFWKNADADTWTPTGYEPDDLIGSIFTNTSPYQNARLAQVLSFTGGPGVNGGKQILLRAAAAALLNAAHPANDYELSVQQVVQQVNTALASGNRATMLAAASDLAVLSEQECALRTGGNQTGPLPDLIVVSATLGTPTSTPTQPWTAVFKNVGVVAVDVNGVVAQGWYSADTTIDPDDYAACGFMVSITSLVLEPGDEITRTTNCGRMPQSGHLYLLVEIDMDGIVAEADETNNVYVLTLPN